MSAQIWSGNFSVLEEQQLFFFGKNDFKFDALLYVFFFAEKAIGNGPTFKSELLLHVNCLISFGLYIGIRETESSKLSEVVFDAGSKFVGSLLRALDILFLSP